VVAWLPLKPLAKAAQGETLDCVLLDLKENCALPESLAGYEAALKDAGIRYVKTTPGRLPPCRSVILPACVAIEPEAAREVSGLLRQGSTVVLESGGGFADPAAFSAHQKFLQAHFDLQVEEPISLWEGTEAGLRVPYVDYRWPLSTKIRDFSCLVPLSRPPGHVIASVDGSPVAGRRKVGKGTLVFLGSPLGPLLWSGDSQAHSWFRELETVRKSDRATVFAGA
jgi:hypothetical protein